MQMNHKIECHLLQIPPPATSDNDVLPLWLHTLGFQEICIPMDEAQLFNICIT